MNIVSKNKIKLITVTLTFVFSFLFSCFNANASIVYLNSTNKKLSVNEVFRVDFIINTESRNINGFESYLIFDNNLLDLQKIYSGNSTVDFWIKSPRVQGNKIFFSGITPGGYNGDHGKIFSALFVAKKTGITSIEIENNSKFLLNDDNATEDKFKANNLLLEIVENNIVREDNNQKPVVDNNPVIDNTINNNTDNTSTLEKDSVRPEEFTVKVIKDKNIGDNKFSIIFHAQDKGSGINYYEIKEGNNDFIKAESPYVLKNQNLTEEIQVKAVDLEGNYRIQKIGPLVVLEQKKPFNYNIIIISLLFVIFVLILLELYLNNRRKRQSNEKNNNI